ncbi:MAG TPA: hypothetical protein VNM34_13170 [Verrucomicrobiae bacterium]|nr:hypothetical protein [Verrucomicrobiae bacterium]
MIETVAFLALVLVVMVAGIRVGMLVAPRITRWADRADEDPNDR